MTLANIYGEGRHVGDNIQGNFFKQKFSTLTHFQSNQLWQSSHSLVLYLILLAINHPEVCWWLHDDVIKWKHFPRYWPFVRGIHRSPVNSPHKGQWRGALMFSLICTRINGWVKNGEAGDLRRHRAHYDVTVMRHRCGKNIRMMVHFPRHINTKNDL